MQRLLMKSSLGWSGRLLVDLAAQSCRSMARFGFRVDQSARVRLRLKPGLQRLRKPWVAELGDGFFLVDLFVDADLAK